MFKKAMWLGMMVVLAIAGFILIPGILKPTSLTSAEKKRAMEQILGRAVRSEAYQTEKIRLEGKYFSLSYLGNAQILTATSDASLLEARVEFYKIRSDEPGYTITVQVFDNAKLDIDGLEDFSAVKIRKDKPDLYIQEPIGVAEARGISFAKTKDGSEKSVFFLVNDKIYSLSISGVNYSEIFPFFDEVVSSISFF